MVGFFKKREVAFEAFLVCDRMWPAWATEAYESGLILKDGIGRVYLSRTRNPDYVEGASIDKLKGTDWIIKDSDGHFRRCDDQNFQRLYVKGGDDND